MDFIPNQDRRRRTNTHHDHDHTRSKFSRKWPLPLFIIINPRNLQLKFTSCIRLAGLLINVLQTGCWGECCCHYTASLGFVGQGRSLRMQSPPRIGCCVQMLFFPFLIDSWTLPQQRTTSSMRSGYHLLVGLHAKNKWNQWWEYVCDWIIHNS